MGTISKPNTFSSGTTAKSAEVNSNFDTIYNEFNGSISNENIDASAGIVDTKLAQITTASKVSTSALTGTVTNVVSTTNIQSTTVTATNFKGTTVTATNIIGQTMETVAWTDFFASATVVGFSDYTSSNIYYKKVGDIVFVNFLFYGTSNSTSTNFTVPYTASNTVAFGGNYFTWWDKGVGKTTSAKYRLAKNTGVVQCYADVAAATWSNTLAKFIEGEFWYVTT